MNKPQPRIITIWRIAMTVAALLPAFALSLLFRAGSFAWYTSAAVFALLFLGLYLVYFPLLYNKMSYGIESGKIIYTTGVFTNRTVAVPLEEIRFVTVASSVLGRVFGLSTVIVTAAGGRLIISGLLSADAEKLALAINH